jgi:energy-coupling factor transporter transmembrane protein EcfT
MINQFKITIENLVQFATILLQIIGLFILKPDIFNFQGAAELFAGGNIYNFILIFISIILLFLSHTYQKSIFATKWFFTFIVFGILFIAGFFYYDNIIENKTIVFYSESTTPTRYVKGNRYALNILECANSIKKENPDISEIEIIRSCEDITSITELNRIWPEKEIIQNMKLISICYCILISLASIALICGLQALRCKRVKM